MKIKNIMLITFLLLAVLTIGAVSASDDVALDNVTASDDADTITVDDDPYEDYSITIDEDPICIDPDNEDDEYDEDYAVASLDVDTTSPEDVKGSFQLWKENEKLVEIKIDPNDDEHWEYDDEMKELSVYILLKDIDLSKINNGDLLSFKYFDEGQSSPVDDLTVYGKVSINNENLTLTDIEVEYDDVEVTYFIDDPVVMDEGWEETPFVEFVVIDGLDGRIVIYLNETLAFNKTLSDVENEDGEYIILLSDLNINQPGKYIITSYFYANNGTVKYNSTNVEKDEIIITLYESQTVTINNVTIKIEETEVIFNENDTLITIDSDASEDDEITISVEGLEPITIKLNDTRKDDEGNYIIGSKELKLPKVAREYVLNITYKGKNITNKKINLKSNVVIKLENDDIIYCNFDDEGFVFISLDDDEIGTWETLEGKINLTMKDSVGNIIYLIEKDIESLLPTIDEDTDSIIIFANQLNHELNGTYTVTVRYFDGNEAETQVSSKVTFKKLTAEDYGAKINPTIKKNNETVITFTDIPIDNIVIEIDGKEIDSTLYLDQLNDQEGNYHITYDKLKSLEDGFHSISVYIENNDKRVDLANGTILVDLKENIDPALTVNVSNVEEGNDAIVLITTNSTFTGEVQVQVANETYKVNVTNGKGNVTITGLKADKYNATAIFTSNGIFNDSIKTTTFNVTSKPAPVNPTPSNDKKQVKKQVIKLTLKKVKIRKSAKKLVITATLKINGKKVRGKTITFKFKGKTYKKKTNKNGVAKLTIKKKVLKKLKVGKKVTYTAKYSTKKVKRTIKVKK